MEAEVGCGRVDEVDVVILGIIDACCISALGRGTALWPPVGVPMRALRESVVDRLVWLATQPP